MADEQMTPEPETEKTAQPKKKLIKWILLFVVSFLLVSVGNYFHLKSTYIPPRPPPPPEQKKPVLTIDLGGEESEVEPEESVAETTTAAVEIGVAMSDSIPPVDSVQTPSLQTAALEVQQDTTVAEPEEQIAVAPTTAPLEAKLDSAALKRSAKLAKIVENMPPEDAAAMLQPLSDDMVIDILLRLKQRQAAKIMAEIPASRAAAISRAILEPSIAHKTTSISSTEP